MMNKYRVDRDHWAEFDLLDQMANIGAEVGRTIDAYRNGDEARYEAAKERAFDLFDATCTQLAYERSPRLWEVQIAQSEFRRMFIEDTLDRDADAMECYFTQFAVAARVARANRTKPS